MILYEVSRTRVLPRRVVLEQGNSRLIRQSNFLTGYDDLVQSYLLYCPDSCIWTHWFANTQIRKQACTRIGASHQRCTAGCIVRVNCRQTVWWITNYRHILGTKLGGKRHKTSKFSYGRCIRSIDHKQKELWSEKEKWTWSSKRIWRGVEKQTYLFLDWPVKDQ